MEEIEVTARFSPHGKIIPLKFLWQGSTYNISSIGRNWKTNNWYNILVMDFKDQVFHLLYKPEISSWFLLLGEESSRKSIV